MKGRRLWLLVAGGVAAFWVVMTAIDWRLTRHAEGAPCAQFTRDDLIGKGFDFSPRTTMEKQMQPAEVRSAGGEPYPDCVISNTSYRCHQVGPAMVQVSHFGKRQYFEVPDGKMAVLYGREGWANCVLQPDREERG